MNGFNSESPTEIQRVATKTVDPVLVKSLLRGMLRLPIEKQVRFKSIGKTPSLTVTLIYDRGQDRGRVRQEITSIADEFMVNAVLAAMGNDLNPIQEIKAEEHPVEDIDHNFELVMFKKFLQSAYEMRIKTDWISPQNIRYLHAEFVISYKSTARFFLQRDKEVERLLDEAFITKQNSL